MTDPKTETITGGRPESNVWIGPSPPAEAPIPITTSGPALVWDALGRTPSPSRAPLDPRLPF